MNKAAQTVLFLSAALALAGCGSNSSSNQGDAAAQGNLVGAKIGSDFALTDQNGKTVKWADFKGKYRLVYFGYTYCPDVCPLDLQHIMAGYRQLEREDATKAAKIQPIFITVDPQRDTSAVIKTYVAAFHPRLIGLTGSPEQIEAVKKAFVVVASKEGDQKAAQDYLVNHTRTPFLFDPDGKPIALVPIAEAGAKQEDAAKEVHDFLAQFVS